MKPADLPPLVPLPAVTRRCGGEPYRVTERSRIVAPEGSRAAADLAQLLRRSTGYPLPVSPDLDGDLRLELTGLADGHPEHYRLEVSPGVVRLQARTHEGLFRAVQTLRQLLPASVESRQAEPGPWPIPPVEIEDWPRYGWRGVMLDPARHFLTVDEVKRFIDLIARYKLNVLHLHLTDDQGWRIEIDRWPRLAAVGGASDIHGGTSGYYTKDQYREIVRHAADHYLTVVPEIDLPGHTGALRAAYPDIWRDGTPSEAVFGLLEDVLREVAALTPGPYLHIGGDEAYATSPEDYRTFLQRAQQLVDAQGKTMIGWGEICQVPMGRETVVQYWGTADEPVGLRDLASQAAARGARLVMSPSDRIYLDMKYRESTELGQDWAGCVDVRDSYDWDPATLLDGVGEPDVLGVEAPLWGETVTGIGDAEQLAFPRLLSAAEIGWSPAGSRSWEDYRQRLAAQAPRWATWSVNFYRSRQVPWK